MSALDGLRGFAALLVVTSHASLLGLHLLGGLSLAGVGKPGVFLFFVLSAWLLTRQWLRDFQRGWSVRWAGIVAAYGIKRVLRIYPMYAIVLFAGWALGGKGLGVPLDMRALLAHLAMLQGKGIYWSVPVEFTYYLLLPLVAWVLTVMRRPLWQTTGMMAAVGACLVLFPPSQASLESADLRDYLVVFLCGAWAAAMSMGLRTMPSASALTVGIADIALIVALVATVPSVLQLRWPDLGEAALHRAFLAWGVSWAAVLLALQRGLLPAWRRALSSGAMRACGRWSFSLYLLHMPVLYAFRHLPGPAPVRGWIALVCALAVAALAHRLIERPCIALGHRWSQGLRSGASLRDVDAPA